MKNLQALNITSVGIRGRFSLDDVQRGKLDVVLKKHEADWPELAVRRTSYYHVEEIGHRFTLNIGLLHVTRPDAIPPPRVLFSLNTTPTGEWLQQELPGLETHESDGVLELLGDLGASGLTVRLRAQINWAFPPETKRAVISLPMMTIQGPGIPLTEVSGIRLRNRTSEGLTTATIDLREDRFIITNIAFPWPNPHLSRDMLDDAVEKGTEIMNRFLLDSDQETSREGL